MPQPDQPHNQDQDNPKDLIQAYIDNQAQELTEDMVKGWVKDVFKICEAHRLDRARRNRESSARWRARLDPNVLRAKQRVWEKDYRERLKQRNPSRYTRYCKGDVNS